MSGTYDCDDAGNAKAEIDAAFILAQSSPGWIYCQAGGLDDIWACGRRNTANAPMHAGQNCGPVNFWIGNGNSGNWQMSNSDFAEAAVVYKTASSGGGIMCCKN